jgi:hypothetical protein
MVVAGRDHGPITFEACGAESGDGAFGVGLFAVDAFLGAGAAFAAYLSGDAGTVFVFDCVAHGLSFLGLRHRPVAITRAPSARYQRELARSRACLFPFPFRRMRLEWVAAYHACFDFRIFQLAVFDGVLFRRYDFQVLDAIVELVSVDMMHIFEAAERAPDALFHDNAVDALPCSVLYALLVSHRLASESLREHDPSKRRNKRQTTIPQ